MRYTTPIHFRADEAEAAHLREEAERRGSSVSEIIRQSIRTARDAGAPQHQEA